MLIYRPMGDAPRNYAALDVMTADRPPLCDEAHFEHNVQFVCKGCNDKNNAESHVGKDTPFKARITK